MIYYPIFLDLRGCPCLVVGGDIRKAKNCGPSRHSQTLMRQLLDRDGSYGLSRLPNERAVD
jgi:hypothetical protein